jgi:recombination-promoting nuclease RpnB
VPKHEDKLMTIAEQLEQKGIEKGKLEVARNMLLNGMDRITVMQMTGLTEEQLSQIDH